MLGINAESRNMAKTQEQGSKYIFSPAQDDEPTRDYQYHDVGKAWITVSNWGFIGNPDANTMPYYPSCEYPGGSDIDFLFQAAVWFGAIVGDQAQPDTFVAVGVDGWLNTGEAEMFPTSNEWDTLFVRNGITGYRRVDDDGDWAANIEENDLNKNGKADHDYDGRTLAYFMRKLGYTEDNITDEIRVELEKRADDDGDGQYDEEPFDGVDNDGDGLIDEDCEHPADANGDGDPSYDPEPNIDEDPKGDPYYRGPGARLTDGSINPNYDWTQPYDDDGDGRTDEDGIAISEQDFMGTYRDVHKVSTAVYNPLGIEVTQKTYAWSYSYSDDYILVDYTIKNVGGLEPGGGVDVNGYYTMRDCWLGIYVDGDVGPNWNTAYSGIAQDDYTGFNNQERRMLGYIFDGPQNYEGQGDNALWSGFLGVRIIDVLDTEGNNLNDLLNSDELDFSFNWWLSDSNNADLDESPMIGPTVIDAPKYRRMSNLEDDYHALKNTSAETQAAQWTAPEGEDGFSRYNWPQPTEAQLTQLGVTDLPSSGYDTDGDGVEDYGGCSYADSYHHVDSPGTEDTRFLVSYGPFATIGPEDSLKIVVGIICGEYYQHLIDNAYWAKSIYDNDYQGPAPPPSPPLTVKPMGGGQVRLEWTPSGSENTPDPITGDVEFEGYRIWRSRTEVQTDFTLLAEFDMQSEYDSEGNLMVGDTRYGLGLPGEFEPGKFYTQDFPMDDREDYHGKRGTQCGVMGADTLMTDAEGNVVEGSDGIINTNIGEVVEGYYFIDDNVAELFTYYYAVTAFDRGVPAQNVPALNSSINTNMTYMRPSNPAGKVYDEESKTLVEASLEDIKVVPNPYRGTEDYSSLEWGGWESAHTEYDRRMDFINLPKGEVTIRIYTLAGDLVQTLGPIFFGENDPGRVSWDMLTKSRQRLVSGVYIYSVEAEAGTHVGKFAVIR
jgi:hypothetical protein